MYLYRYIIINTVVSIKYVPGAAVQIKSIFKKHKHTHTRDVDVFFSTFVRTRRVTGKRRLELDLKFSTLETA